ncbi:hypothetical protein ACFQY4_16520 [Catellatospora bangladeshensis]|uniref:Uncharacterized protein n=1 Tax=Catellatospora bangladeshensis TaxID=310355 RepID=A0A8J3JPC4_9ACTN|nr:hypothetical protein [Catellatospora bangladeshensis]GIF84278.1 hypothetical protein Cba03nite_56270 [Catellatospora bangladeshensis]
MSAREWRLPEAAVDGQTYFAHALSLAALHGPGPWPDGGAPLPDARPRDPHRFTMSDTVLDGVRTQHAGVGADAGAAELTEILRAALDGSPSADLLRRLHDVSARVDPLAVADGLTQDLAGRPPDRVRELGRWLAENGVRRGPVALGIVLIGLAGEKRDADLLLRLGALETLTLYAVVALLRTQPHPDRAVYVLARRVGGWGRIHAVQRLRSTRRPEIKAWLLREGYRNSIMDEYLAYTAATTGDLAGALAADEIDDELLRGAGGILYALCLGGPAEGMDDYPDGAVAVERYLRHVAARPPDLVRTAITATLRDHAASAGDAWSPADAARLHDLAAELCARPDWRAVVVAALSGEDPAVFQVALWPARLLGIPFVTQVMAQLRRGPYDSRLWYQLVTGAGDIDEVLRLAEELLPLADLATGPALDLLFGSAEPEDALDMIVSRLDGHPGKGWPLIRAALANRSIRNRNMALNALEAWPVDLITPEMARALATAAGCEPDREVRRRMNTLRRGWPSGLARR